MVADANLMAIVLGCACDIFAQVLSFADTIRITLIIHRNLAAVVACFTSWFEGIAALACCWIACSCYMTLSSRLAGNVLAPTLTLANASVAFVIDRHAILVVACCPI